MCVRASVRSCVRACMRACVDVSIAICEHNAPLSDTK